MSEPLHFTRRKGSLEVMIDADHEQDGVKVIDVAFYQGDKLQGYYLQILAISLSELEHLLSDNGFVLSKED